MQHVCAFPQLRHQPSPPPRAKAGVCKHQDKRVFSDWCGTPTSSSTVYTDTTSEALSFRGWPRPVPKKTFLFTSQVPAKLPFLFTLPSLISAPQLLLPCSSIIFPFALKSYFFMSIPMLYSIILSSLLSRSPSNLNMLNLSYKRKKKAKARKRIPCFLPGCTYRSILLTSY